MIKVIRVSIYEWQFGLMTDLSPFAFFELIRRIKERRKIDPVYDQMKGETFRWLKITAIWWVTSFSALVGGVIIYAIINN